MKDLLEFDNRKFPVIRSGINLSLDRRVNGRLRGEGRGIIPGGHN